MTHFPETRLSLLDQVKSPENQEAWQEFTTLYQPVIYRMARRRGLQDADALDLVQDVLIRVSNAIDQYEKHQGVRFRNWLGRVASNAVLSALVRSRPDSAEGGTAASDMLEDLAAESETLSENLDEEVIREQFLLAAAVVRGDVDDETWLAFEKTVMDGRSCKDAAAELGKSIGTIYAARSRVFRRLRNQMKYIAGEDHE